ncbi:MAG: hypothetical protein FD137_1899 [Spirochaetes bacterium]|nr:MAG: hypothetical protein FD137_1899 [Spirochaetota bacterium]
MKALATGGYAIYGQALGILMLDTRFPRIPGDIGNASTFPFSVRYAKVRGASPKRVVREGDPSLLEPFISAAQELQAEGVKAITTSCGFLAAFQEELSASVDVPVFTSSLLQIPFLHSIFGEKGEVGVLTARAASLERRHFEQCGAAGIPCAVMGMDEFPEFSRVFLGDHCEGEAVSYDILKVERELAEASAALVADHPNIRCVVLECTNMPPFRTKIQEASGKPVYDIVTLAGYVYSGLILD